MMFTPGKTRRQLVAGIGADPHEGAGAEREQAGIAGEDVEPDRRQREDQERDHHRLEQEARCRGRRRDDRRRAMMTREPDAVLPQREHRLSAA